MLDPFWMVTSKFMGELYSYVFIAEATTQEQFISPHAAGDPHAPYSREALDAALHHLHGFYRTSVLLWQCQDWRDWESMARIYDMEKQWAQVCCLPHSLPFLGEEKFVSQNIG